MSPNSGCYSDWYVVSAHSRLAAGQDRVEGRERGESRESPRFPSGLGPWVRQAKLGTNVVGLGHAKTVV